MRAGETVKRQKRDRTGEGRGPRGRRPGEAQQPARMRRRVGHTERSAVGEVRRELREFLRHRSGAERIEEAELLLSELVTNALIHTRHGAVVTATASPAALRVEVQDFEADLPAPYVPNADDGTHGRGLILVRSLADAWGVEARALGKVVWFELRGEGL
ncbi:anti-sigma regulatory factor (Ser/Thr protein kinase) [Streptomyces cavourensis]|nr:anti-sigma regulatory factor (Ser/Thr protein kinase) [Streptomyces cavourensis]GGU64488.1 ATP-binding protein [Streptomyces cavourensis]SCD69218.1 Anti-sigma regulatory factor (Ser/Thr protein kinase) [Streptomyces sp. DvalAA-19]